MEAAEHAKAAEEAAKLKAAEEEAKLKAEAEAEADKAAALAAVGAYSSQVEKMREELAAVTAALSPQPRSRSGFGGGVGGATTPRSRGGRLAVAVQHGGGGDCGGEPSRKRRVPPTHLAGLSDCGPAAFWGIA